MLMFKLKIFHFAIFNYWFTAKSYKLNSKNVHRWRAINISSWILFFFLLRSHLATCIFYICSDSDSGFRSCTVFFIVAFNICLLTADFFYWYSSLSLVLILLISKGFSGSGRFSLFMFGRISCHPLLNNWMTHFCL